MWMVFLCLEAAGSASSGGAGAAGVLQELREGPDRQPLAGEADALALARELLRDAGRQRANGDPAAARASAAQAIDALLRQGVAPDAAELGVLRDLGRLAYELGDVQAAERALRSVHEALSATLPDDHADLLAARQDLAGLTLVIGDLPRARQLFEQVLAARERTLSAESFDLQAARMNLAGAMKAMGDLQDARGLEEQALEVLSRTLAPDDLALQKVRQNLALTIKELGDLQGARELEEQVLAVRLRALPPDHPDLQAAKVNLGQTIRALGDLRAAQALFAEALQVLSRSLPEDHPDLQIVRESLAATIDQLGGTQQAIELQEQVLAARSRTLPEDHPQVQRARLNLASSMFQLGDFAAARRLQERALEVFARALPEEHSDLQAARLSFASTLLALGDLPGARALQEQVLQVFSRTLPEDHPHLQAARQNLSVTLEALGDYSGAQALEELALASLARTLPGDHPDLQMARLNLAGTQRELGDLTGARRSEEQVLAVLSGALPADHIGLLKVRLHLAATLEALGDLGAAQALEREVLEAASRSLPEDHPELQMARGNLAATLARLASTGSDRNADAALEQSRKECTELLLARALAQTKAARDVLLESSPREASARCETLAKALDLTLSFASGYGVFGPIPELERAALVLGETTRGGALASAALLRRAADVPAGAGLRRSLRDQNRGLAALAQGGTNSAEFQAALARRDRMQRELVALLGAAGGLPSLEFDPDAIAARLDDGAAAVAMRRYARAFIGADGERSVEYLCATILRPGASGSASLTRVDLGPVEPIEAAVVAWRATIGAVEGRGVGTVVASSSSPAEPDRDTNACGRTIRRLVLDPLLPTLAGANHLVLVLDGALHLVPIDALPVDDGQAGRIELVGERWRVEMRCTLAELLASSPPADEEGTLVALGGASFDVQPPAVESVEPGFASAPSIPPGSAGGRRFAPLPFTGPEVREIAALYAEAFGDSNARVLEGPHASRGALEDLAPQARWLHVATHGWFASESIPSWQDPEPLDRHAGIGTRLSGEEQIKGMSPMLLCGLALAGANLPEDAVGRAPGLITAEELAELDFTACELAVLSACDTSAGERRAGQGVASLQMALQMAGARSVITSLWKVSDEATKDLMLAFYRHLWLEGKPKWQALWEAKMSVRDARDEHGRPLYATRDWAAWVLTGEPD